MVLNSLWIPFFQSKGIFHQRSRVETPQHNDVVERNHQHSLKVYYSHHQHTSHLQYDLHQYGLTSNPHWDPQYDLTTNPHWDFCILYDLTSNTFFVSRIFIFYESCFPFKVYESIPPSFPTKHTTSLSFTPDDNIIEPLPHQPDPLPSNQPNPLPFLTQPDSITDSSHVSL